jgi:hypothetical protein
MEAGDMKDLAKKICTRLDEHLAEQQHARNAVSTLAAGAAFEGWLAFETRLLVERSREDLGLGGFAETSGKPVPRFWMANEYCKIDFYIGDVLHDVPVLAFEFKLIHNNKNWSTKADEVWGDLFPSRAKKAELVPQQARFGVVGVIGKVYRESRRYPGQYADLLRWERELDAHLLPLDGWNGKRAVRIWCGQRFQIDDHWLHDGPQHFFQLHLLGSAD